MPTASAGENDRDQPEKRAEWNRRGREAPKGESAAALRLRAYQHKMLMRAQRAAAAAAQPAGAATSAATTWVSLGPSPLASDATGNGSQDYNWVSGRATSVLIDAADTTGNTVLLGGAYGGLWKSTTAGSQTINHPESVVWQALIDDQPSLAVGAMALQPGNSNLILVGTGEANSSSDSYYGMGILRSTNGGATWGPPITSAVSGQSFVGVGFSKMAFSTSNTNLVVASTAGDNGFYFGLEQDGLSTARGLYYSTDAGATWNRVTLSDSAVPASASGVVFDASQGTTGTFYAAIRRHGIYSSTDGQHFTRLLTQPPTGHLASANCPPNSNLTSCQIYRAEFAVTPGRNELYVWIVDVQSGVEVDDGIWRTINGGTSWTQISETGITHCGDNAFGTDSGCGVQQGAYNLELAAVPNSAGTDVYAGTINIYKCTLTSNTQTACSQGNWLNLTHVYGCNPGPLGEPAHVHPDQHGLAFMVASGKAPGYFAHDGGISRTLDGYSGLNSGSCTTPNQFDSLSQTLGSMTEFVSFSVHPASADTLLGGTQDNGSPKTMTGTSSTTWQNELSGDGGYNAINPNPGPAPFGDGVAGDEWFVSNPFSVIQVCEDGTVCNDADTFLEAAPGVNIDQGPFYTPYILDPQNTNEMLIGTCRIWRGDTASSVFTELSVNFDTLDATLCNGNEISQVAGLAAGGPMDTNGFSNVVYATTWGPGPLAGVGGGEVWATTNAATTGPANVTGNINPKQYAISSVAIDTSAADGQTAYVGIMGFHTLHVWKTTNAGASWTDWTGTGGTALPDAPVSSLLVDSATAIVYAGTDVGVFSSPTTGAGGVWTEVGPVAGPGASGFLPSAPVTAIQIFNNGIVKELRVSTYGRGIWEFNLPLPPDFKFAVTASPSSTLLNQNQVWNGTLAAVAGYSNSVNLTCTAGAPSTCTFSPSSSITPTAAPGTSFSVTVGSGTAGTYNFSIQGTDGTLTHSQSVSLTVNQDFTVPATLTAPPNANPGQQTSTSMALDTVPAGGTFSSNVTYACTSGLPTGATCSFSPTQINSGGSGQTVTVTVQTAGPFTGTASSTRPSLRSQKQPLWLPLSLPLAGMILVGLAGRRLPRRCKIAGLCMALAVTGFLVACGGGSSSPPPVVTVTAPTTVNNLYPNLTVNPPSQTHQFAATVSNSTSQTVTWAVVGTGNGSIDPISGLYTAPAALPNPNSQITVSATSTAATSPGTATVHLQTPTPAGSPTVTVTVTEGSVQHTTTFTLTVN